MVMLTSMILRAAALLAKPSPCVHDLATPRPQLTRAEQAETKRVIRAVVADLGGSKDFAAVLVLVASRESSLQRGHPRRGHHRRHSRGPRCHGLVARPPRRVMLALRFRPVPVRVGA